MLTLLYIHEWSCFVLDHAQFIFLGTNATLNNQDGVSREVGHLGKAVRNKTNQILRAQAGEE